MANIRSSVQLGVAAAFLSSASALVVAAPNLQGPTPVATQAAAHASAWKRELLELGFDAATKLPIRPHIKNRARAQQVVAEAALAIEDWSLAEQLIDRIPNWRRGACFADFAYLLAADGESIIITDYLTRAELEARKAEDWRRDRIRVKIGRALARLGRLEEAAETELGVIEAETGKVAQVRAESATPEDIESFMALIDKAVATNSFELTRNAMGTCVELYRRLFHEDEIRQMLEGKVKSSWSKLPIQLRIEFLLDLANISIEQGEHSIALRQLDEGEAILDAHVWKPEHELPFLGKIAAARARAGDLTGARARVDRSLTLYRDQVDAIMNFERADALRPVAEACVVMNDRAVATAVYGMALDANMLNPNGRPRAEDISATCASMVTCGYEPSPEMLQRIRDIVEGLTAPW